MIEWLNIWWRLSSRSHKSYCLWEFWIFFCENWRTVWWDRYGLIIYSDSLSLSFCFWSYQDVNWCFMGCSHGKIWSYRCGWAWMRCRWNILIGLNWSLMNFDGRNNGSFNLGCCFLCRWIINSHQNCSFRLLRKLRNSHRLIFWSRLHWKDSRWNSSSAYWRNYNCWYIMSCRMGYCSDDWGVNWWLRLFTYWSWRMVDWRDFDLELW